MTNKLLYFPGHRPLARAPADPRSTTVDFDSARVAAMLRAGVCPPDASFDQFLPDPLRSLSSQHWTPLVVAARAAQWFDECNVSTIIDIGSGAGKFCVAAALAGYCRFVGLEHREHLVACARTLARTFGVQDRAHFIHGALGEVRLPSADAYYLYNPFEENVLDSEERIDQSVELSGERMSRDVEAICLLLDGSPAGTYVLTYNGFGGALPPSYSRVRVDTEPPNPLCLWRKVASRHSSRSHQDPAAGCAGAA
jgi:hypothetical protein